MTWKEMLKDDEDDGESKSRARGAFTA